MIQLFVLTEDFTKQLVLVAKSIFKFDDSQRKTIGGWVITYIRVRVRDVSRRLAHETKAGEVVCLALESLILLWAGGVIAGEVEVAEGDTRSGHHLLELLLIPKAALLLALALVAGVIPVVLVVLVGELNFFCLGQSVTKWVVSSHSKQPLGDLLLSLQNMRNARNFLASRTISSSGMLS
jgi:hypothetical protein